MDYRTASDVIEDMFMNIHDSVWLPRDGFEQWSTFYLQRHGMTLDRIKTFLRCFNAAVKQKITSPGAREIAPEILAGLRQASRFDVAEAVQGNEALATSASPNAELSGRVRSTLKMNFALECLYPARHEFRP
jgi:hypothetical protein